MVKSLHYTITMLSACRVIAQTVLWNPIQLSDLALLERFYMRKEWNNGKT